MPMPWEEYAASAPSAPWEEYSAANRVNNDAISKGARSFASEGSDALGGVSQAVLNLLAGGVRGAGSIGATFARPFESSQENSQRRAGIDANMQSIGAQPDSWMYRGGKLGGEIAGTAGVGGVLSNGVRSLVPFANTLPELSAINGVARGLETGGFRVGALAGTPTGVAARIGTGAAVGGASAGMVNPEDAGFGAAVGAAMPAGAQLAGKVGDVAGSLFSRSPQPTQRALDTARQSMDAGYVIPPNMVQPSFTNQLIESISGKQATQQLASTRNTEVTDKLVRQALGLPEDASLTQGALESLRKTAGRAYADVSSLSPQAASDLEALKQARNDASGWFNAYNRSASPDDLAKAKAFRGVADTLESSLEAHAAAAGRSDLIPALRDARTQIAKTYTVGRALNDASGTVDARVLGRMYEKGSPLSDGLDVAGQFASAFPKVAISPQQIGSPAAHNLRSLASMFMGGSGYAALGPFGVAAAALPFAAPPLARAVMFSKAAQRGLLENPTLLDESVPMGLLTQGAYRAGPLLTGQ